MAIKLTDKPNTEAATGDYPFGNVRDKTSTLAGTPVNKEVYADFHQFFEKLMNYAGVTHNGLPDNDYSGWQLMEALMALMGGVKTKIVNIGQWNMYATGGGTGTVTKNVNHGLADHTKIRQLDAIIIGDDGLLYPILQLTSGANAGARVAFADATKCAINIEQNGLFDTTNFDSSIANRGYLIIRYVDDL
jgi:hypothetical protein